MFNQAFFLNISLMTVLSASCSHFSSLHISAHNRTLIDDTSLYVINKLFPVNLHSALFQSPNTTGAQCSNDLDIILGNSFQDTFKFWDSFAVPWTGIAEGHFLFLGQPEECVNAKSGLFPVKAKSFPNTKPFLLGIAFSNQFKIQTAVCMPSSCSNDDVAEIFEPLFEDLNLESDILVTSRSNFKPDGAFYIAGFIYGMLICLVFTGTSLAAYRHLSERYAEARSDLIPLCEDIPDEVEVASRVKSANSGTIDKSLFSRGSRIVSLLLCFDFQANFSKLITPPRQDVSHLSVLNGIRTMTLGWVVLAHTMLHEGTSGVQDNPFYVVSISDNFLIQGMFNASLSVDSFFLMSGMLVMMGSLKALEKQKNGAKFWIMYYVHRVIRLWPALLLALLFLVGLYPLLPQLFYSPLFETESFRSLSYQCRGSYWVTVALFVNNFDNNNDPNRKPCMTWTWYLADDMQFYCISPIFIILSKFNKKMGALLISGCILISTFTTLGVSAHHHIGPIGNPLANPATIESSQVWTDRIYEWPFFHFQVYGIGLLLGLVFSEQDIIRQKLNSLRLKTRLATISGLWFYAIIAAGVAVYGVYPSMNGHLMGNGAAAMYNATFRILWSTALGIMITLCAWGYGGVLNRALSANFWVPFARIGYTAYIIHVVIIWIWLNSAETSVRFSTVYIALQFTGIVVCVYCLAIVVSCFIEAPFIQLEKLAFSR